MTRDIENILSNSSYIPIYRIMDTEIVSNVNGIDVCMGIYKLDKIYMEKTSAVISIYITRWYNIHDNTPIIVKSMSEYWCPTYEQKIIEQIRDIGKYDSIHMVSPGVFISSHFSNKEHMGMLDRISILSSMYNIDIEQTTKDKLYSGIIFNRHNNRPKILLSCPYNTTIDDIRTLYHEIGHFEQDIFNQKEFDRKTPLGYVLCEEDAEIRGWKISDQLGDYVFDKEYRRTEIDRIHRYRDIIGIVGLISGFERADVVFPICFGIFDTNITNMDISLIECLHGKYSDTLMRDMLYNNPEKFMLIDKSCIDINKSYNGLWDFDKFSVNYIPYFYTNSRKNLFNVIKSISTTIDTRMVQCFKHNISGNVFSFIIRKNNDIKTFIETVQYIFTIVRDVSPDSLTYIHIYYDISEHNIYKIDIIIENGNMHNLKNKYTVMVRSDDEYVNDMIKLYLNSFSFRYDIRMMTKDKIIERFNNKIHLMYKLENIDNIFDGIDKTL